MKVQKTKRILILFGWVGSIMAMLAGCSGTQTKVIEENILTQQDELENSDDVITEIDYQVIPETFCIIINQENDSVIVSLPGEKKTVADLVETESGTSWTYPDQKIAVAITPKEDYLSISLTSLSTDDHTFQWPSIIADTYYLPLGEGKRIPKDDPLWSDYFSGQEYSVLEQFSMPFWAGVTGDHAALFILEDPYRTDLQFAAEKEISFQLALQYLELDSDKEKKFRIYLTDDDPVAIAKIYRNYVTEQNRFVSLEQKAEQNANIEKLYGAPHIYLWANNLIAPDDINWSSFRAHSNSETMKYLISLAEQLSDGEEGAEVLRLIRSQEYVDQYQKNVICRVLTEVLKIDNFYQAEYFPQQDEQMKLLLAKGRENLNDYEKIALNQHALSSNFPDSFHPVESWMKNETVDLLTEINNAGIERAWIGLNDLDMVYVRPEMVKTAVELGYLIGPYDSYHSVHEPGKEQWITALFDDKTLYEEATISKKNGEKITGFKNIGRKLNPTLTMPAVKQRVEMILSADIPFNSWFIDCDATGEIYDDYSPSHQTTQQQDLAARLERMAYFRDQQKMVIGSEGGNDFAASTIAFAHGIELGSFSWMDEDMSKNKDSEYFLGKYYHAGGGVAEHFSKQIPLKESFYHLFLDMAYQVPLYKLVYNDSVITSYHWDWSTFKIEGAVEDRMLREILYNTPPLYHLDRTEWEKYNTAIVEHTQMWSQFSKQVINQEMTGFKYLTEDGLVQMTEYGESLSVIANFSDQLFSDQDRDIPAHSLQITDDGKIITYSPVG